MYKPARAWVPVGPAWMRVGAASNLALDRHFGRGMAANGDAGMGAVGVAKREVLAHMTSTIRRAGALVEHALLCAGVLAALSPVASAQGPWKSLFNGKDLSNFIMAAGGRRGAPPPAPDAPLAWQVQNGVIVGEQKPGGRFGMLASTEKYFDFELELEFLLSEVEGVKCSQELGPKQENLSDPACTGNSGVYYRSGYQLNIGRREGGEYIGLVVHRVDPKALRGSVLWLSYGDRAFPNLRKRQDWNALRIVAQGERPQAWLNGTKIVDVTDTPTLESEAAWRQPAPISFQLPHPAGITVQFRNIRIRPL